LVEKARVVVTNGDDHANATCTLLVREHGFTGPLFALADDPLYRAPMIQIGATEVFTPDHVLGAALASRASRRISPPAEGMHLLGARVGMAERCRGLQGVNHRLGDQADAAFGASEAPGVEFGVLADHQAGRDVHPSVNDHAAQPRAA